MLWPSVCVYVRWPSQVTTFPAKRAIKTSHVHPASARHMTKTMQGRAKAVKGTDTEAISEFIAP